MSLYDDLGVETSDSKTEGWSKNFKLLQSQLQVKKAALTQAKSQRTKQSTVLAPVIDLKRGGSSDDRQIADTPPHVAAGLKDPVPSGFSAGEVLIPLADEYDPMFPNDYEKVVKRQREERQRQRELERQKEIEEREKRRKDRHEASGFSRRPDPDSDEDEDYERERRKRSMGGAAIAPPTSLVEKDKELPRDFPYEEDSRPRSQSSKAAIPPPVYEEPDRPRSPTGPSNSFLANMGGTVAHKIMQKYGFREGQGLGKHEQGLSTALSVEKTSKRGGKIIVGDATEKGEAQDASKKSFARWRGSLEVLRHGMAEAPPVSGTFKFNTDAAEFIPQERKTSGLNCGTQRRLDSSRIGRRNYSSSPPCHLPRHIPYEDISAVHQHSYASGSKPKSPQGFFQSSNKSLKNHGLQNQPWQKARNEKHQNRNKKAQGLSEQTSDTSSLESVARSESGTNPREHSPSESEKEVVIADPRGAKPKKAAQLTYNYGRGPKAKGRLRSEWGNRMSPKSEDENTRPVAISHTDSSDASCRKPVVDPCVCRRNEQRRYPQKRPPWEVEGARPRPGRNPPKQESQRHINAGPKTNMSPIPKDNLRERPTKSACDTGNLAVVSKSSRRVNQEKTAVRRQDPQVLSPFPRGKQNHMLKNVETHTGSLIEQLTTEKYECMVCCELVQVTAPVWSCQSCFHVFHLNCIKKWARSPASHADGQSGWRCPACQNVSAHVPNTYTCFCGKVKNPEWSRNEIPHSCGEVCRKKQPGQDCPHSCNLLCHPGPCPPCPAFTTKTCECGRTRHTVRCGQPVSVHCSNACENILNCGQHHCAELCHGGQCQPCRIILNQVCYCGSTSRDVLCGTDVGKSDGFGDFSCLKICGKDLKCGSHTCSQVCHPQPCQPCPRLPHLVRYCPCGQTPLSQLLEHGSNARKTCMDPVPSCGKVCGKPLACGSSDFIHTCEKLCHEGDCGPCSRTSVISCRCSFRTKELPCTSLKSEDATFMCDKRCNKKRLCGRHKCNEICCVDKEHKCPLICGRKLRCGLHRCEEPCHRGNCQTCWQASFDELTCHCGASVIYPPVPCGTRPPECTQTCARIHECDHPVYHSCHSEEKCPPCTFLTQKWCMGKHELRSNIPCHLVDISCGLPCSAMLPCGMHKCQRLCHKGECLVDEACKQPCTTPRGDCGHPCMAPCHPSLPCPVTACKAKVELQCECGRRKEMVICSEASGTYQRIVAISMASKITDMQLGDSVEISKLITKKEVQQARLQCDEECAALERRKRLAEAFDITDDSDPFNVRSSASKFSDSLKDDARKDLKFVSDVEKEMETLVEAVNKGKNNKKSHCFPPMNRDHRRIIHDLAQVYGLESISYDSEPKRNVVVTAVRGKSVCPPTTLTSVIERETQTRPPPPIPHHRHQADKAPGSSTLQKIVKEAVIDYFDVQD